MSLVSIEGNIDRRHVCGMYMRVLVQAFLQQAASQQDYFLTPREIDYQNVSIVNQHVQPNHT